jgi:chemotaxis protein MotA
METDQMANVSTTQPQAGAAGKPSGKRRTATSTLDPATILGVLGGFAMIIGAMVLGGTPGAFVDMRAILIVVGGSFMITTVSFSLSEVAKAQSVMMKAVAYRQRDPQEAALQVLYLANLARKNGALGMESHMREFRHEPFLKKAMDLVIDGTPGEEVERIMMSEAHSTAYRHERSAGVLRRAGEVAPAMGLIGTLVGLVQMLGNLEDPSTIGPAMAVALLTTFYGAVLANMVFLPLANKLERNSGDEAMVNQIYAMGAASIGRQENPRRLETVLNTILPPARRVNFFE